MIKLIIFDMDGTLVETDDVLYYTWDEMFRTFKDKDFKYDYELTRTFSGPSLKSTISKYLSEYPFEKMKEEYTKRTAKYYDLYAKLFDNEVEILQKFKDEGYKLAVLTNKNRERTLYCLNLFKIADLFETVVTSDDVKETKPDPEGLKFLFNHYKDIKSDEMVLIGDTDVDYLTAENGKIKCILMEMCIRKHEDFVKPYAFCKDYEDLYKVIKNG